MFIKRYMSLSDGQALVCALWAINTYVYDRFPVVPYLESWADMKRSGKSTLAEILSVLCRGGRVLSTVRVLSMVKLIEAKEGAYVPFIEEAERFARAQLGDERAILASGYRRGAVHELEKASYSTYCPKAFVLIGNVHEIIRDRCISIKLDRKAPPHNWTLDRYTAEAEAADLIVALRDNAKTWDVTRTADDQPRFPMIDPTWLVSARDREIWTPLFSVAAAMRLHADTLSALKRASVDLSILKTLPAVVYHPSQSETVSDDANAAEAVLRDLVGVLADGETFIPSVVAVQRLQNIDVAPWRGWRGDGLTEISLAALLHRFGIDSVTGQVGKGRKERRQAKGYRGLHLRDALQRLDSQR
jgi:hypothetical protein